MACGSGFENNEPNNEEQPFVIVVYDTPLNLDARMMILMELMVKTNENMAMIMARQDLGQSNARTQIIF